jgi:hypothetical protein
MSTDQQHFDAARQFQEFYDQTLRRVGAKAPQPILGQSVNDYRRETLRNLKRTFLPEVHPLQFNIVAFAAMRWQLLSLRFLQPSKSKQTIRSMFLLAS